nr:hypothetical protein [Pseudodesulfovibrio piezophilus]
MSDVINISIAAVIRLTNLHGCVLAKHAHCGRVEAPHQIFAEIAAVDDGVYSGGGRGVGVMSKNERRPAEAGRL